MQILCTLRLIMRAKSCDQSTNFNGGGAFFRAWRTAADGPRARYVCAGRKPYGFFHEAFFESLSTKNVILSAKTSAVQVTKLNWGSP